MDTHSALLALREGNPPITVGFPSQITTLQWRHNGRDGVSNHQPHDCLLDRLFKGADQRKHLSSASLAFARGIHREPGTSPHKWPVTRKMFPFDDVIMSHTHLWCVLHLNPNKLLNKPSSCRWFKTPWCSRDVSEMPWIEMPLASMAWNY